MGSELVIKEVFGRDWREQIDAFYATNGSKAQARDTDLYFVASEENEIVGAVRYCIEEKTPLLRTMMISAQHRRRGIGTHLLSSFAAHLELNKINDVFCLPYVHLERFYAQIGFYKIEITEAPHFLQERWKQYLEREAKTICMKRN